MPFEKVTLCNQTINGISVYICAEVMDGNLRISGQDIGESVAQFWGESEIEYFYDFNQENSQRLFRCLSDDPKNLKDIFVQEFSGLSGCERLREFCKKNKIKYRFFSR